MESANSLERHSFVTLSAKKALVGLFIAIIQFCSYVGSDIRTQSRLSTKPPPMLIVQRLC